MVGALVKWWRRLVGSGEARPVRPLPVPTAAEWREEHRNALRTFFRSEPGQLLLQRMFAAANENARAASLDAMHSAHSAGRAAGFFDGFEWLHSQAHIEFAPAHEISGASAAQDALSAQSPRGEAMLREMLSP